MNDPTQNEAKTKGLRREIAFRSAAKDEIHEGAKTYIKDPDRMLSIVVLVLACLGLALLAHVVV